MVSMQHANAQKHREGFDADFAVLTYDYKIGHPLHATLLQLLYYVEILALNFGFIDR